jgi:hypothetical protein
MMDATQFGWGPRPPKAREKARRVICGRRYRPFVGRYYNAAQRFATRTDHCEFMIGGGGYWEARKESNAWWWWFQEKFCPTISLRVQSAGYW